ncbi:tRNA adenosine(34) deaminase TadA [Acinetobacter baumannii]|nr:tRNA adenosine(34) deaminase TadA [Acinetobacter baumannii]
MSKFSDEYWMQLAYEQAELAAEQGEIPVGAVIVSQNKLIGAGFNAPIGLSDPTAHAEIQAIRAACESLKNYRLPEDATLYVTLEPCTMCVGALVHARIKHVVFGTTEPKAGSLVSARQLLENGYYNHKFTFEHGCLHEKCAQQLSLFLSKDVNKRNKRNNKKRP